jgi:hypothetical protein
MQSNPQMFKGDLIGAIWNHGIRMIKPTIIIGIVTFIITSLIGLVGFSSIFGWDMEFLRQLYSGNPLANQELMRERMEGLLQDPVKFGLGMFGIVALIGIIQTVIYTILLKMSGNMVEQGDDSLGTAWSKVKGAYILNIILSSLVILVIYLAIIAIAVGLGKLISPAILILFIPFIFLMMLRFTAVVPAIVLGDKSVSDALKFSWYSITFKRAFLIFVGFIVVGILSLIFSLILTFIAGLLGQAGIFLNLLVNLALNVFFLALGVSFLSALYYRYTQYEGDDSSVEAIGTE